MQNVADDNILKEYRSKISSLSQPQTSSEWKQFNKLQPIAQKIEEFDKLTQRISDAKTMLQAETDEEMLTLAREELAQSEEQRDEIFQRILQEINNLQQSALNQDDRNAILEIRAGTGGEEASLFAGDLFRMYSHFAQNKGYFVEVLNQHLSETGGIKELSMRIEGEGVFGELKYESGVHRVQRVPSTESAGRIHTSTASVAVMPEAEDIDVDIKPEDITLDTFRASGAGGQHINKTDSAVRITHHPTGIVVSCQENRSQIKNRKSAMSLLRSRIYDHMLEEQHSEMASLRKSQIGSAKRSEKIRTYNFPQNRITDHRIKKTWHNITEILNGSMNEMIEDLKTADQQPVNL